MLSRIDILKRSDLPNRIAFETEPYRDEFGILRIKFSSPGDPAILLTLGSAKRLADEIRLVDRPFALQIDACVEKAKRASAAGSI